VSASAALKPDRRAPACGSLGAGARIGGLRVQEMLRGQGIVHVVVNPAQVSPLDGDNPEEPTRSRLGTDNKTVIKEMNACPFQ
jgi:hypothetical protein